jgi:predicted esterase
MIANRWWGQVVCALVAISTLLAATQSQASEDGPEVQPPSADYPGVVVYAPIDRSHAQPITLVLHGMCGEPKRLCDWFAPVVTQHSWLICPRASGHCDGGGAIWPQYGVHASIEAAIERVKLSHPGELDETPGRTLIGFSQGAFRGLQLAEAAHGQYPRVLLIAAMLRPDAQRLEQAGVSRLLLSAGEWDMTYSHLRQQARQLARSGVTVTFQSLGPVGHTLPQGFSALLEQALSWTSATDRTSQP